MAPRKRRSLDEVIADTVPDPVPTDTPPPVDTTPRKYTMLVSPADDERAHRVVDDVVRRAGIRATKPMRADVVRALFAVAAADPELRAVVAARLRDGVTP